MRGEVWRVRGRDEGSVESGGGGVRGGVRGVESGG